MPQLRLAAFILPSLLLSALMALEYFVVDRLFPLGIAHLITLVIGLAGILAFSVAIFRQLAQVQERERQSAKEQRRAAEALEQRRQKLSALNAAGLALTSELDRDEVLQRVVDQARNVANAKYAALGVFEVTDDGVGFDYESATSGHGLGNMSERAFAVGGTLLVESRPGRGARVRLDLPGTIKEPR